MRRRTAKSGLWWSTVAYALVAATVSISPATGRTGVDQGDAAVYTGCHQVVSFVRVPRGNVENRVGHFKVLSDDGQMVNVQVKPFACESVVEQATGTPLASPVRGAAIGIEIQDPDSADDPEPPVDDFNFYLVFLVVDSQSLADWLRANSGLDARYMPRLV
jgi:hypothetical protein